MKRTWENLIIEEDDTDHFDRIKGTNTRVATAATSMESLSNTPHVQMSVTRQLQYGDGNENERDEIIVRKEDSRIGIEFWIPCSGFRVRVQVVVVVKEDGKSAAAAAWGLGPSLLSCYYHYTPLVLIAFSLAFLALIILFAYSITVDISLTCGISPNNSIKTAAD